MSESSGEQTKVKPDTGVRILRRWEDRIVLALGAGVLTLVGLMWSDLKAQITDLEKSKSAVETKVAVQHAEIAALKDGMARIEALLTQALQQRKNQ